MTGSYCLSKTSRVSITSHIFITACASKYPPPARTQACKTLTPLANSTFHNRVTRSGPLAVDASFQFVDVRDLETIDLLLIRFLMILWSHNDFLSRCTHTLYEFIVVTCKQPNYDYCIYKLVYPVATK